MIKGSMKHLCEVKYEKQHKITIRGYIETVTSAAYNVASVVEHYAPNFSNKF